MRLSIRLLFQSWTHLFMTWAVSFSMFGPHCDLAGTEKQQAREQATATIIRKLMAEPSQPWYQFYELNRLKIAALRTLSALAEYDTSFFLGIRPHVHQRDGCGYGQDEDGKLRVCWPDCTREAKHPRSSPDCACYQRGLQGLHR